MADNFTDNSVAGFRNLRTSHFGEAGADPELARRGLLILPTPAGCEMRSAFWLGELERRLPVIGGIVTRLINR